jgi:Tfp pilus assembly protein PilN
MININLLPKQHKEQIKTRRFNLYLTSLTTIVLFLIGLVIVGLFFLKISLNNQTKNLDRQIQEKNQELAKYNEEKNLIDNFNQTLTIAKELISKETNWSAILNDLETAVPDQLRLSAFGSGGAQAGNQNTAATTGQISISGVAANQRTIVKFIEKLKTSKYFTNPELISTKSTQANPEEKSASAYSFEMSVNLNEQGNQ